MGTECQHCLRLKVSYAHSQFDNRALAIFVFEQFFFFLAVSIRMEKSIMITELHATHRASRIYLYFACFAITNCTPIFGKTKWMWEKTLSVLFQFTCTHTLYLICSWSSTTTRHTDVRCRIYIYIYTSSCVCWLGYYVEPGVSGKKPSRKIKLVENVVAYMMGRIGKNKPPARRTNPYKHMEYAEFARFQCVRVRVWFVYVPEMIDQ